ncbi:hypothetical protein [uncultured Thiohalocapsa sp.]|uniref:hypothetical protein n=1 Tax=uncultured Thiohalocapsa sp. TaxID=768990 RepID=UPI0025E60CC9|nr:hypothetical protein [uncultured Thiohalocapsa sp.]
MVTTHNTRTHQPLGAVLSSLREVLARLDIGTVGVRLVAAGLVIGVASLVLFEPAAHRNTDTTAERIARLSPVGEVRIATHAPTAAGGAALQASTANGNASSQAGVTTGNDS